MPIIGLLAGRSLAGRLGHGAHWIGAALLIATGAYTVIQAIRTDIQPGPDFSPDLMPGEPGEPARPDQDSYPGVVGAGG